MTNIVSGGRGGGYFGSDYFVMLQGCSITMTSKHAYQKVYVYYYYDCSDPKMHCDTARELGNGNIPNGFFTQLHGTFQRDINC